MPLESAQLLSAGAGERGGLKGVAIVGLSAQCFACSAALAKWVDVNAFFYMLALRPITWVFSFLAAVGAWHLGVSDGLKEQLLGAPCQRKLLLLRSALYYGFSILWFFAIMSMPVGDATCLAMAVAPPLSGVYARYMLGEPLHWRLFVIGAVNVVGAACVLQPSFLFGRVAQEHKATYALGVLRTLAAAAISGLLPVLNRILGDCHWTTIQHCFDLLSTLLLTPVSLAVFAIAAGARFNDGWNSLGCVISGATHACAADNGSPRPRAFAREALFANALFLFCGFSLQTLGYQVATHTQHANMAAYLEIPTSFLLQHFVFNEPVNGLGLFGASIIIVTSVVNILLRPPAPAAPPGAKPKDSPDGVSDGSAGAAGLASYGSAGDEGLAS